MNIKQIPIFLASLLIFTSYWSCNSLVIDDNSPLNYRTRNINRFVNLGVNLLAIRIIYCAFGAANLPATILSFLYVYLCFRKYITPITQLEFLVSMIAIAAIQSLIDGPGFQSFFRMIATKSLYNNEKISEFIDNNSDVFNRWFAQNTVGQELKAQLVNTPQAQELGFFAQYKLVNSYLQTVSPFVKTVGSTLLSIIAIGAFVYRENTKNSLLIVYVAVAILAFAACIWQATDLTVIAHDTVDLWKVDIQSLFTNVSNTTDPIVKFCEKYFNIYKARDEFISNSAE